MKNLKIGVKIAIGFGVVLMCTLILSAAVLVTGQMNNSQLSSIDELSAYQIEVNSFLDSFNDARIGTRVLLNTHSVPQYERAVDSFNKTESILRSLSSHAASSPHLAEQQAVLKQVVDSIATWMRNVNELHASNLYLNDMQGQFDGIISAVSTMAHENILDAQLNNLVSDIQSGRDTEALLRRQSRVEHAADLVSDIQRIDSTFNPLIAYHDLSAVAESMAFGESVLQSLDKYIDDSSQQRDKDFGNEVKGALAPYFALVDTYIAEINNNNRIKDVYETHNVTTLAVIYTTLDNANKAVEEDIADAKALGNRLLAISIALTFVAVAIGVAIAFYLVKNISKPLTALTVFMKKAGTLGDIAITPEDTAVIGKYAENKDEIGQLIGSTAEFVQELNLEMDALEKIAEGDLAIEPKVLSDKDRVGLSLTKVVGSLNEMFAEINVSTTQVSTGSKQVADGAQSLAQGATEQASSIEELSSSIAEIASRTKTNAATAEKTAKLSATIKENAEKGSRQMDEMIAAVSDINDASKNISKIIKTIDDIAFQTNILALNAAVEAARAGQHGKGFAVVAEEVRNLASKSAEAAKDTGDMIQNSMDKAELGTRIAGETAESLKEIVTGINESSLLIGEIAQSSDEQSQGIAHINIGINQVAQVVQQNSATAEESAAASEEMSGQSDMLQQLISQFRLKDSGGMHRSLPAQ